MNRYLVKWVIDLEADTPEAAAREALRIQRDPDSVATVFEIHDDEGNYVQLVDLDPEHG